jgi:hypothetical protein
MASILKVDTITGVATAGSIAITGEGNSTTTNLQQGLIKIWLKMNGSGTIAENDSFNVSSFVDNGTGDYSANVTNAMGNADYAATASTGSSDVFANITGGSQATSLLRYTSYYFSHGAKLDRDQLYVIAAGDLA